ncbi:MAG: zf-HC2 domain-containing protein [Acidimicrobiales bacterium]
MRLFPRRPDRPLSCRQVGRLLQRYLDDDVDDLTARRIIRHLDDCRRCGLEAAAYTEIKASLARRYDTIPDDAVRRLREFGERLVHEGPPGADELPEDTAGA